MYKISFYGSKYYIFWSIQIYNNVYKTALFIFCLFSLNSVFFSTFILKLKLKQKQSENNILKKIYILCTF
jgi:hypothetical protein